MSTAPERSVGEVLHDIGGNLSRIVHAELRVAIAKLRARAAAAGVGSALVAAGGVCATLALTFLLLGGMLALSRLMPMWGAALVVSAVTGIAGVVMLTTGKAKIVNALNPVEGVVLPNLLPSNLEQLQ